MVESGGKDGITLDAVLAAFEASTDPSAPLTAQEVATELGCERQTASQKLEALVSRDELRTKRIDTHGRVWWLPAHGRGWESDESSWQARFHQERDFLERVLRTSPVGIVVLDAAGAITRANARAEELLGLAVDDLAGRTYRDPDWQIYHEDGRPISVDEHPVTRALATGEAVFGFTHRIRLRDGTERWFSSNSVPVFDERGEPEAVLVGLEDVTALKERETTVRIQQNELERLNHVNAVIRGIDRAAVTARSRTDLEQAVCDCIADSDPYLFAVIGEFSDDFVQFAPNAHAGIGTEYLDTVLDSDDRLPLDDGPAATAARTGEIQVVQHLEEWPHEFWRAAADAYDFGSAASVPLVYEGFVYGVLGVFAGRPDAFGEAEQRILSEVGETIGYAINTLEHGSVVEPRTRLVYHSERLAEPFLEGTDGDSQVSIDAAVPLPDGTSLQYWTTVGVPAKTLKSVQTRLPTIVDLRLLSTVDDRCRVEVRTTENSLYSVVSAFGGQLTSLVVDESVQATVEFSSPVDADAVTTAIREIYPDIELVSERRVLTLSLFESIVEANLTDRQLTALRLAHVSGYFTQPRESTGEELADRLGIAKQTFHYHLRNAEASVFEQLFEASSQEGDLDWSE